MSRIRCTGSEAGTVCSAVSRNLWNSAELSEPGVFVPSEVRENLIEEGHKRCPRRGYKPEQIVMILRQVEVAVANGKSTPQACKEAEINTQSCGTNA